MSDLGESAESRANVFPQEPDEDEPDEFGQQISEISSTTPDAETYRSFCLQRLRALIDLRRGLGANSGPDVALHQRLVDRSLYSAYRDCVAAEAKTEARALLEPGFSIPSPSTMLNPEG